MKRNARRLALGYKSRILVSLGMFMTKRRHLTLSKYLLGRRRNNNKRNALISVFRLDSFRSLDLMGVGFHALGTGFFRARSLDLATPKTSRKF